MSCRRLSGVIVLGLALIGASGCGSGKHAHPPYALSHFAGHPVLVGTSAADFALRDENGALQRLSSQRGHVVLLTFLYTHCRDVCPLIAEHLQAALTSLGAARADVRVFAVSVDPVGDTPHAVHAFVAEHRLGPQFSYLTGTRAQLQPVWQAYNVLATPRNTEVVDHFAPTLLIDAKGRPRVYYDSSFTSVAVLHDLRRLLGS